MATLQGLPDLAALQDLPFYLNQAGMQQVDMANQFNQQGLQQNQAALEGTTLDNLFKQQNNPQLLQKQAMDNEGMGYTNRQSKLKTENMEELNPLEKEARRAKLLAEASEDKLKELETTAKQWIAGDDPVKAAKGQKMLEGSWAEQVRRSEQKNKVDVAEATGSIRKDIARMQQEGADTRNQRDNDTRLAAIAAKNQKGGDVWSSIASGKMGLDKGLMSMLGAAMTETDPALAAKYQKAADVIDQMIQRQKSAQGGKLDMSEFAKVNPFVSNANEMPTGVVPRPSPQASAVGGAQARGAFTGSPEQVLDAINSSPVSEAVKAEMRAAYTRQTTGTNPAYNDMGTGIPAQAAPAAPAPAAPASPPVAKLSEVMKMYPGKSEADLRAAWKKKFGVDLQ